MYLFFSGDSSSETEDGSCSEEISFPSRGEISYDIDMINLLGNSLRSKLKEIESPSLANLSSLNTSGLPLWTKNMMLCSINLGTLAH